MRRAFTLIEVLVVIGILITLAGMLYVLAAPARVEALKTHSKANMRQIYVAMLTYTADNGGPDRAELSPMASGAFLINNPANEKPYGLSEDIRFSPIIPRHERLPLRRAGSYFLRPFYHPPGVLSIVDQQYREFEIAGSSYPIIIDQAFDEYYYWPREQRTDPLMQRKFLLVVTMDGSVKSVREPGTRRFPDDD